MSPNLSPGGTRDAARAHRAKNAGRRNPGAVQRGGALPVLAGRRGGAGLGPGRAGDNPRGGGKGDLAQGTAVVAGHRRHPSWSGPHRTLAGPPDLGAGSGLRRRRRWPRPLGSDDAEHHPDGQARDVAARPRHLPGAAWPPADLAGRPGGADQGLRATRPHPRSARGASHLWTKGRGVDRRAAATRRAAARLREGGGCSWRCLVAAPGPWPRWARSA